MPSKAEVGVEKTNRKSFFRQHKWKLAALAIIIIVAVVLLAVLIPKNKSNTNHANSGADSNGDTIKPDPTTNLYDDTARPNSRVPPLNEPFPYGKIPVRGVNAGGWLVLEPFIAPSLFEGFQPEDGVIDEWTLCQKLGKEECKKRITKHYETFYTEADFKQMAEAGLDHVRIPIGYWAVDIQDGEPFIDGSWEYLLKGVNWARKYGLRVMVELHGAPGSQNGWNHSGRSGEVRFLNGPNGQQNADRTMDVVVKVASFFSKPQWKNVAPLFGVLNEPVINRLNKSVVDEWYYQAYQKLRNVTSPEEPVLVYHEGFIGLDRWSGTFQKPDYKNVCMDVHNYIIFDVNLVAMSEQQKLDFACNTWKKDISTSNQNFGWTMVGEFSIASNDCAKWLNGIGLGTRWDGTFPDNLGNPLCPTKPKCSCEGVDDWKNFTPEYKEFLSKYGQFQMEAFESSFGWFFWTWKTENHVNPHWDYQIGLEQGWMPKDAGNRQIKCPV
ncbi:hypothetical protein K7432_014288 [Basidiobolus ranarum]|uniref:glucan 1,3-beta-glucosidase n=1 Tax=Basidiobolus ranarum TaxID=34480 RepID=A0ABR2VPT6_9FUNG